MSVVGLGVTQKKLLYEMNRNDGTYPPEWKITPAQRAAFKSLERRGMVNEVTVDGGDLGLVHTYRLAERDLAGEDHSARVADFVQSVEQVTRQMDLLRYALEEMGHKARRL
jgi:hypothetical protein